MSVNKELGLVQVYTGDGKGKTTAALGLAMRALGHGFRVHVIQFMKGRNYAGEIITAHRMFPYLSISQFGRGCRIGSLIQQGFKKCMGCGDCFFKNKAPEPQDYEFVELAMGHARKLMENRDCDVLILDEIGNALRYNLVTVDEVLELISSKPADMELVLTGRGMPQEIIDAADLVTEMKAVKHPFTRGVPSRRGIEY